MLEKLKATIDIINLRAQRMKKDRERHHWNWYPELLQEAQTGNRRAQRIIEQAKKPGKYFDGKTHLFEVINVMNHEIQEGATHIGIFGSRLRRNHRPLHSDVDLLVIRDEAKNLSEVTRSGLAEGINIVRYSPDRWQYNVMHTHDDTAVREIMQSVKWLWVKKGHSEVSPVHRWFKMTF